MVACHNFDLDAAKAVGFKTAFVRRPDEWGSEGPPDPDPNPQHDIIVDSFPELAHQLGRFGLGRPSLRLWLQADHHRTVGRSPLLTHCGHSLHTNIGLIISTQLLSNFEIGIIRGDRSVGFSFRIRFDVDCSAR